MDVNNFQRVGASSNTHAGREFEEAARLFWAKTGVRLQPNFPVPLGYEVKKVHRFDLVQRFHGTDHLCGIHVSCHGLYPDL